MSQESSWKDALIGFVILAVIVVVLVMVVGAVVDFFRSETPELQTVTEQPVQQAQQVVRSAELIQERQEAFIVFYDALMAQGRYSDRISKLFGDGLNLVVTGRASLTQLYDLAITARRGQHTIWSQVMGLPVPRILSAAHQHELREARFEMGMVVSLRRSSLDSLLKYLDTRRQSDFHDSKEYLRASEKFAVMTTGRLVRVKAELGLVSR